MALGGLAALAAASLGGVMLGQSGVQQEAVSRVFRKLAVPLVVLLVALGDSHGDVKRQRKFMIFFKLWKKYLLEKMRLLGSI